ncbi:MAG: MBL fold metallo-hydrolase [Cyanobacteriota bacterium]
MYQKIKYKDLDAIKIGKIGKKINTNCIVYRINETVIDTGPPNQWKQVKDFLDEKKFENILITHHHEDHSGNGFEIRQNYDTKIYSNELSYEYCKNGYIVELYRRYTWGKPKKFNTDIAPEKIETNSGLVFLSIKTPGHSDDMNCYLETNRGWLFTGDLYISSKITHSRKEENPYLDLESLTDILKYDFSTVFCSHRGVLEDGKKIIQNKINYLTEIKEKVSFMKKEGRSLSETTKLIMGKEDFFTYISMFNFSKKNFIKSFWDKV